MRITVVPAPELGLDNAVLDVVYNESVENVLYRASLQYTTLVITEFALFHGDLRLDLARTLADQGVTDSASLFLRPRSRKCCQLV